MSTSPINFTRGMPPTETFPTEALERYMPQATWRHPEGGFFVGVTLPAGVAMADLMCRAADAGVKLSDGRGFYLSKHLHGDDPLRVPMASFVVLQNRFLS